MEHSAQQDLNITGPVSDGFNSFIEKHAMYLACRQAPGLLHLRISYHHPETFQEAIFPEAQTDYAPSFWSFLWATMLLTEVRFARGSSRYFGPWGKQVSLPSANTGSHKYFIITSPCPSFLVISLCLQECKVVPPFSSQLTLHLAPPRLLTWPFSLLQECAGLGPLQWALSSITVCSTSGENLSGAL